MTASKFLELILLTCMKHKCSVSSWIRTEKHNEKVGGSSNSQHLLGLAVDLVPDDTDWDPIVIDLLRLGLKAIKEKDHIHVQALNKLI